MVKSVADVSQESAKASPRKLSVSLAEPQSGKEVLDEYSGVSQMLSEFPVNSGQQVSVTHAGRVKDGWAYGDTHTVKMFGGKRERENEVRIHGTYVADYSKKSRYANKKEEVSVYYTEKPETVEKSAYFDATPAKGDKKWVRKAYSVVVSKKTGEIVSRTDRSDSY